MADIADDYLGVSDRNNLDGAQATRRSTRTKYFSNVLSSIAAAVAVAGLAGALGNVVGDRVLPDLTGSADLADTRSRLDGVIVQHLRQLQGEVTALQKAQAAIAQLPTKDRATVQIAALAGRLEAIERRQSQVEQVILNNPEKALSMPLMRRDIENLRDNNTQSLSAIKQSVDQIYDLTKWLLGALAVGVFSLAIANFFTKK
jgi:hypothetical protein